MKLKPIIPDANIKFFESYYYDACFCFYLKIANYKIRIGIEDVQNMNEYNERRVVCIEIYMNNIEIAQNFVETMNEASVVVEHLRRNQLKKALQILYRFKQFPDFKKIRTSDEIDVLIKNILKKINRT